MRHFEPNEQNSAATTRYSTSAVTKIILIYAAFSSLWILVSDSIVGLLFSDPITIGRIGVVKGWLFVAVTALLLHGLIRRLHILAQKSFEGELLAQTERIESERLIRALYQAIPDLVWFKDTKGVYLSCNSRFEQFFGASEQVIVGKSDYDFVNKDLADTFRTNDLVAMEKGIPVRNEELVTFASDGHREFLETTKTAVLNSNGQVIGVLGIGRDISERKKYEIALIESEARWKFAIEGAGDGLWDWDIQTGKAFYSLRYKIMLGFAEDEIGDTADEWSKRIHPEDAPGVYAALQPYMEGKPGNATVEFRMLCKDGHWMWTLGRGMVVKRDSEGKPLRMIGTNSDISERKLAEKDRREQHSLLQDILATALDGYWLVDTQGQLLDVNIAACSMLGYTKQEALSLNVSDIDVVDSPQDIDSRIRHLQVHGGDLFESRHRRKDGSIIHVEVSTRYLSLKSAISVFVRDITQRKMVESKLQLAASVFGHAREGITITDVHGTIIDVNETFTQITGFSREDAIGQNPRILSSGRQDNAFYKAMWKSLIVQGHWAGEIWNRRKNGEVFAELLTISAVRDEHGNTKQYVALFSDITSIKEHQRQLECIAHFDALTHLPNRLLLSDRLRQAMAQASRRNQQLAVAYLDLDGFKTVNDRHGHGVGDQLLVALAAAMNDTLREGDTLARIGGDEFVAVLIDVQGVDSCTSTLDRLVEVAAAPVQLGKDTLLVSVSIGVTFYPQSQDIDADQLLRQADNAMYQAKRKGKNRFQVFNPALGGSLDVQNKSV